MAEPNSSDDLVLYRQRYIHATRNVELNLLDGARFDVNGDMQYNGVDVGVSLTLPDYFNHFPAADGSPAHGENIVIGPDNAIAEDLGTATILGGGSSGYENVIGAETTANVNTSNSNLPTAEGTGADWSAIIAGYDNVVNGDACQVAGYHCKVEGAASHGTISGGSIHSITDGDYGTIGGGTQNSMAADQATIAGGSENAITNTAAIRGTIGGGGDNSVAGYAGTVAGGEDNVCSGTGAVISGGTDNTASANFAAIGGGQNAQASAQYATVAGGNTNVASQTNATVAGGATNTASGNSSTVGGGLSNTAGPGTAATVVGGRENVASVANATAMGRGANAFLEGMVAHADGIFAANGDAQCGQAVLRNSTTDATETELFLNGATGRLTLFADSTWAFTVMVVARRTDANDESAGYKFEGVIDRQSGGTTALVGSVAKTVLAEDNAGWDVTVDADSTNGALRIKVTGEAAKTIRWVARVNWVSVIG